MSEALPNGTKYAGYRIQKLLGRGGMGVFHEASREDGGARVALKILHAHLHANKNVVKRFEREAAFVRRLSGDHVVPLIDFGVGDDGSLFMTLELVTGVPLDKRLADDGSLPLDLIVRLTIEIARGLEVAHDKGIVHRDLKPANVMLEDRPEGPRARVCDFGLGKALGEQGFATMLTDKNLVFGTPEYMAPEQVKGEEIDVRTDIYSLGCVLYELLTGRPPFVGKTSMATLTMHLSDDIEPPSVRAKQRKIPGALDDIAMKALSREAEGRFQTTTEMIAALSRVSLTSQAIDPLGMTQASDTGETPAPRAVNVSVRPPSTRTSKGPVVATKGRVRKDLSRAWMWVGTVGAALVVGAAIGWWVTR